MIKTIVKSEGMMCSHCEAHMNDAIRNAMKVESVKSSARSGETEIVSADALNEEALRAAIAPTGYKVLSVTSEPVEKNGLFSFLK